MTQKQTDYIAHQSCKSLPDLFLQRVRKSPDAKAYSYFDKENKCWTDQSWKEMFIEVCRWRHALSKEKMQQGDRVAVMLPNSIYWVIFEQAALSLGFLVVPLYSNDRPENIAYILNDTSTKILICPGRAYFKQLAPELENVPSLQRIITTDDCQITSDQRLACLSSWLPENQGKFEAEHTPAISEIATIVYTSGTTGPPKGVMLSHDNILSNCNAGLMTTEIYSEDSFLSFLPLSHMLERTAGYYMPMMAGASVNFARSIPDLAEDLLTIKPTVMVAVPRIFEKMYSTIITKVATESAAKVKLFETAIDVGWKKFLHTQNRGGWEPSLLFHPILDKLVGQKVRDKLGGNLRIIIAGGAALSSDISRFFIGLGLPIYQGYGLTETSPVISVNRQEDNRPEGVGRPLIDIEVKIGDHDELLVRGPCVMQGYWKNEAATSATVDAEGWLHTGDKGVIDTDGHIRITGRLKEIIVLSNGEKVAPTDMELAISLDPLFEHNIVIGESRPYLTLACVLNQFAWQELAEELGVSENEESLQLPEVKDAVRKRLDKQLAAFPGYVFIKDVTISLSPWTVENGLLTPTLKMKRKAIEKHLESDILSMYQ